jgi:enoyl-CoA hydratase/carnithine racemase
MFIQSIHALLLHSKKKVAFRMVALETVKLYYGTMGEHRPVNFKLELTPEGVLIATLNNPAKLNALDGIAVAEFFFITEFAEREPSVKVVVWTGSGRAFSAGANFSSLGVPKSHHLFPTISAYNKAGKGLRRFPDVAMKSWLYRMLEFNKISICAVNGICIGGGANFALLMHDFVFCAEGDARFKYPFADLGIPPEMGSSFLFPRLFAKRYVMTGDWFDGADAEKIGLVYKVVPRDKLMSEAIAFATSLATNESLEGMQMSKRILNDRVIDQLNHYRVCDIENETIDKALVSDYTKRSMQRFLGKHGSRSKL